MSDTATERRFLELLGAGDERLIFIRSGYCERYDTRHDKDPPLGGGSHNDNATGAECDNFRAFKGEYYIYAGGGSTQGVNLARLGAEPGAVEIGGVTVIQVATRPEGKQVVVGWFRGATAYAEFLRRPFPPRQVYCFRAPVDRAILLPPDERTIPVPKGKPGEMGQSQVRYASDESGNLLISEWMVDILKEIKKREARRGVVTPAPESTQVETSPGTGQGRGLTPEQRKTVEDFAMARAIEHFQQLYDTVEDVHDREPFDLLCSNRGGRSALRVEVKGTTGDARTILVTAGEVISARAHRTALFIASELTWADTAGATLDPTDWRQDVIDRWAPTDHDLNPTAYEWQNPAFKPKRK
jgi:hypothetical protein